MDPNQQAQPMQAETPVQPELQQPVNNISPSRNKWKLVLLIIILLVIVGAGAYLLGTKQNIFLSQNQQKINPIIVQASPAPIPVDSTANWKIYLSDEHGFEFKYPSAILLTKENKYDQYANSYDVAELKLSFPTNLDFASDPCNVEKIFISVYNTNIEDVLVGMGPTYLKDVTNYKEKINTVNLSGYRIDGGSDYCKFSTYYLGLTLNETLRVQRNFLNMKAFSTGYDSLVDKTISLIQYQTIQDFINSYQQNQLFDQILSTFKSTN